MLIYMTLNYMLYMSVFLNILNIVKHILFKNIYVYINIYALNYNWMSILLKIYLYIGNRQTIDMVFPDFHLPISSFAYSSFCIL